MTRPLAEQVREACGLSLAELATQFESIAIMELRSRPTASNLLRIGAKVFRALDLSQFAVPQSGSILRCDKHGGKGFVQDCEVCKGTAPAPAAELPEEPASLGPQYFQLSVSGYRIKDWMDYARKLRAYALAQRERADKAERECGHLLENSHWLQSVINEIRDRAEKAEEENKNLLKRAERAEKEAAINAENFHVTNQALCDYDRKRIEAESRAAQLQDWDVRTFWETVKDLGFPVSHEDGWTLIKTDDLQQLRAALERTHSRLLTFDTMSKSGKHDNIAAQDDILDVIDAALSAAKEPK